MATVFLAHDLKHDRPVALKVLHPEFATSVGPERFQREIRFAARLQHPHILSVYDSGAAAGQLWFTMPYVEGEALRSRLRREVQLPVEEALRITREAAQALHYAHEQRVVHRDIKPENLLLTRDGNTLVADFGIARALGGSDERLTETGLTIGTPAYMSPEQASGDRGLDARTDIYSLATVLYEMLAGEPPYTGPTAQAIITKRLSDPVPSVRRLRSSVPPAVDQAVTRALAPIAADRYTTAAQFAQALAPSETMPTAPPTLASAARPPFPPASPLPMRRGRRLSGGVAALGIGFVMGLGLLFAWRHAHEDGATPGPKHLAVLPFENQGDSADAYFADGITDELRGKLATLPGLEVIASRSSNDYRRTTKSLPEIARELGVDYLLVGKIRWQKTAGGVSAVQVSPELIWVAPRGAPTTRWSQPFDAPLTDVFQVQADIASRVAQALDVALGTGVPEALAARPTANTEAYDDYLRANEYWDRGTIPDTRLASELYHQAIALDSTFALAWARLARAEAWIYWFRADHSAEQLSRVDQTARRALALAPELPEAHAAMGYYHFWGHRDFARALDEFALASRAEPNDAELANVVGLVLRRQGKWEQAVASLERAAVLDPRSYDYLTDLGESYLLMRRYTDSERALVRAAALGPDLPYAYDLLMRLYLNREGSLEHSRRVTQQALTRMTLGRLVGLGYPELGFRGMYALIVSDAAHQAELASFTPPDMDNDTLGYCAFKASLFRYRSERLKARAYDDSTRTEALARIARHQGDAFTDATLAVADAYLGRGKEAVEAARRAVADTPQSKDALFGQAGPMALAEVYTVVGDSSAALNQLAALLAVPSFLAGGELRADPIWAPLRSNARFERLAAGK